MSVTRFVISGHVDHGKSSLSGRLLLDFNPNYESEKRRVDQVSLADVLDIIPEEKDRHITLESTFESFTWNDRVFELIDTPGHELLIPELIQSMYQFPTSIGVLVVSSVPGEQSAAFERGTMKQDAMLLRAVGVKHLLVCYTKGDLTDYSVSPEFHQELFRFLKSLCFSSLDHIIVSAQENKYITEMLDKLVAIKTDDGITGAVNGEGKTIKCIVKIIEDVLISKGFQCIVHTEHGHFDAEVTKIMIKEKETIMVKRDALATVELSLASAITSVSNSRIILRQKNQTIGFGQLKQIY